MTLIICVVQILVPVSLGYNYNLVVVDLKDVRVTCIDTVKGQDRHDWNEFVILIVSFHLHHHYMKSTLYFI